MKVNAIEKYMYYQRYMSEQKSRKKKKDNINKFKIDTVQISDKSRQLYLANRDV